MRRIPEKITLSSDALFQEIGEEGVILDLSSASYFGLDGVGTRFWRLLQDHDAFMPVFHEILAEYDVEADELLDDLIQLVIELENAGLVRVE